MTTAALTLDDTHRAIVLAILRAHLPPGARIHVFGSRATGHARRYSDLDLAITAARPLTQNERAALAEAFESSDLPWKVDLIDTQTITHPFRRVIEAQWIELA